MDQQELERKALGFVQAHQEIKNRSYLEEVLSKALEERSKLLIKVPKLQKTTVGKVVQERIRLEEKEKERETYIKQKRRHHHGDSATTISNSNIEEKSNFEAAMKRARVMKLGQRITSFRLAGISCFSVGGRPHDLGIRFEVTWGGYYFDEKYYVVLTAPALSIYRHSLPHFIPIQELTQAFLPTDPSQFCRRISRYISSYAGRRVLTNNLKKDFKGKASVENSPAYDIITVAGRLKAKGNVPVHSIQLKFENILDLIPNKADVLFLRNNGEMILQKVILDKIPGDVTSSLHFFNYTLWVESVLNKRFYKGGELEEDEYEGKSEEGTETEPSDTENE